MIEFSWSTIDPALAVGIFVAYAVIDALYAYYTLAVVNRSAFAAATTGLVMHFLLAFGVINFVQNFAYVVPLALGSWVGTYILVKSKVLQDQPLKRKA